MYMYMTYLGLQGSADYVICHMSSYTMVDLLIGFIRVQLTLRPHTKWKMLISTASIKGSESMHVSDSFVAC
jgi:hypothetical protein